MAKGAKGRSAPSAAGGAEAVVQWDNPYYTRRWLFPAQQLGIPAGQATKCMATGSAQAAFAAARLESGIHPDAHVHTLRHSYATHMLEAGVNIRQLRDYLGHESLDTTMLYTHLTELSEARTQATMQRLYQTLPG